MLVVPASAQSGRKSPTPKPTPAPSSLPSESDKADKSETKEPSKPAPPQFVDGERIYSSKEVDERLRILKKPTPGFTREARRNGTRGFVVLEAILAADGAVKHIEVLTGLPDGLSQKAIEAARQIKFRPAVKDGKQVSVLVEVRYQIQVF
jgi:TonB family protein